MTQFLVEQVVMTTEFSARVEPPREIRKGFVRRIFVRMNVCGDDEQDRHVTIMIEGWGKTAAGKPDKRGAGNTRLVWRCWKASQHRLRPRPRIRFDVSLPT